MFAYLYLNGFSELGFVGFRVESFGLLDLGLLGFSGSGALGLGFGFGVLGLRVSGH